MKQLKVALIGGGFMGKAHSLAYSLAPIADQLGGTVIKEVLVEVSPELAATCSQQLGWRSSSGNWAEVVQRDDIDIVDICTPPHFHKEIALAAIAAGKHVFCEKPITNSAAEAAAMRNAANAAGVTTQVGFTYRHTPAIAFAKQLLDAGKLGLPLAFRATYLQDTAFTADPNRWRARVATGGSGTVGDIGSHIIDIAEYLFGDIVRVAARARSMSSAGGWLDDSERTSQDRVDDAGVWLAEFANGAIGNFSVNTFSSGRKNYLNFAFDATEAAVEFSWNDREVFKVSYIGEEDDHQGFRAIHTGGTHPNSWWRLAGLGTGYTDVSAIQLQKFVKAILAGEAAEPDFGAATHVQEVVETVLAAAVSRRWLDVPQRVGADG